MLDTMLLAVDGSAASDAAVNTALHFGARMGATIEVVHVREHERIVSKAGSGPDLETETEAEALLARVVDKLTDAGLTAHGTLLQAPPRDVADAVITLADRKGAEFIVVGSRGLSAVSEALLGSVSHRLVQHAGRPVVIAHEAGHRRGIQAQPVFTHA